MSNKVPLHKRVAALEKAIVKLYEEDLPAAFKRIKGDNLKLEKRIAHLEEFLLINDFKSKIAGKTDIKL